MNKMEELVKELLGLLDELDDRGFCTYEEIEEKKAKADAIRFELSNIVKW